MKEDFFIITNNPMVYDNLKESCQVDYINDSYIEVLKSARNYVHHRHILLSHPLAGSVKPNETPYKSIAISKKKGKLDFRSLNYIESSINMCKNFLPNANEYQQDMLEDFRYIDFSLIENAIS